MRKARPQIDLRPIDPGEKDWAMRVLQIVMRSHVEQLWRWDQNFQDAGFNEGIWIQHSGDVEVVEFGGERAGWLLASINKNFVRLNALYLSPAFQGCGIGAAVLDVVKQRAQANHLPIELSVLTPNTGAVAFYQREGFEIARQEAEHTYMPRGRAVR